MSNRLVLPQVAVLKPNLQGWMIFFIVISSVIGAGIFNNGGSAIKVAGPAGALVALLVMCVIAICVAECISELVQLFPAPNAIVEYIRHLVDEDFGWAIGVAYWLTYSSIFAAQNMTAASLSEYWGKQEKQVWRPIFFYFAAPCSMLVINMLGVKLFGWIEAIGGILKIALVFFTTIVMLAMKFKESKNELQDGFQHNRDYAANNAAAICYVIPIVAFGFIGIEAVAVTAFEAAPQSLRRPSKSIAYFASFLYLICMLSQTFNVDWEDDSLPPIYNGIGETKRAANNNEETATHMLAIIALQQWKKSFLDDFLNGAIIFSVLSASNTALYIASRTLYGMTLRIDDGSWVAKWLHDFSKVDRTTGVPLPALVMSWIAFLWVPFLSLVNQSYVPYMIEIIQTASSVGCLIVWVALTFAYLRYWNWQKRFNHLLGPSEYYRKFQRNDTYSPHTMLISLQPWPAIVGFVGCLVVFVFCSTTWWYSKVTGPKVLIAYAAQVIVLSIFLVLKAIRYQRFRTFKSQRSEQGGYDGFTERLKQLEMKVTEFSTDAANPSDRSSTHPTTGSQAIQLGSVVSHGDH